MNNLLMAGFFGKIWTEVKSWTKKFLGGYGLVITKALVVFVLGLLIISVIKKLIKKKSNSLT